MFLFHQNWPLGLVFCKVSSFCFSASVDYEENSKTGVKADGLYLFLRHSCMIDILKKISKCILQAYCIKKEHLYVEGIYMLECHQWLLLLPQKNGRGLSF